MSVCVSVDSPAHFLFSAGLHTPGRISGHGLPRVGCSKGSPIRPYRFRRGSLRGNSNISNRSQISPAHYSDPVWWDPSDISGPH